MSPPSSGASVLIEDAGGPPPPSARAAVVAGGPPPSRPARRARTAAPAGPQPRSSCRARNRWRSRLRRRRGAGLHSSRSPSSLSCHSSAPAQSPCHRLTTAQSTAARAPEAPSCGRPAAGSGTAPPGDGVDCIWTPPPLKILVDLSHWIGRCKEQNVFFVDYEATLSRGGGPATNTMSFCIERGMHARHFGKKSEDYEKLNALNCQ